MSVIKNAIKANKFSAAKAVSDDDIAKFEKELGVKFGKQYREFLKEFGALSVAYLEFYGICGDNNSIPSAIHATKQNRKYSSKFPGNVVVIADRGDGAQYVVDEHDNVHLYYREELSPEKLFNDFVVDSLNKLE